MHKYHIEGLGHTVQHHWANLDLTLDKCIRLAALLGNSVVPAVAGVALQRVFFLVNRQT